MREPIDTSRPRTRSWLAVALSLLASNAAWAQAEAMPSAAEMAEMQKEMAEGMRALQEEMKDLDPAMRRQLEQMMRGALPAKAPEPPAKPRKTTSVPARSLDSAALKAHVLALQPKIAAALKPDALQRARRIEAELGRSGDGLARLGAAANGLAAWGVWPEAIYLTGVVASRTGSAQDLNNLAAMLSMQHAESAALPILYTLHARYPNNSTLLNNIGQALYGLGDSAGAEKYLTAAIRRSPNHPQANTTQARIQMARGDMQGTQASLNAALQQGYSQTREELLRKSGGKLAKSGMRWTRPMPQDPLELEKFVVPAFPTKATELPVAIEEWKHFREQLAAQVANLDAKQRALDGALNAGGRMAGAGLAFLGMPFAKKAAYTMAQDDEHYRRALNKHMEALVKAIVADAEAFQQLEREVEAIDAAGEEAYRRQAGGYQREYSCGKVLPLLDGYLNKSNGPFEELQRAQLEVTRKHLNETAYMAQFVEPTPELFDAAKLSAQKSFLGALQGLHVALPEGLAYTRSVCFKGGKKAQAQKLSKFEDIHCDYVTRLELPGMGSIDYRCNKTIAKMNPIFAPFEASWTTEITDQNTLRLVSASAEVTVEEVTVGAHGEFEDGGLVSGGVKVEADIKVATVSARSEFDRDGFKSGAVSVEAGSDIGPDVKGGPLKIGAKASGTATLEFDRGGLSDVSVQAGVDAKASSTIGKTEMAASSSTVKAGANSTWSWNSGVSGEVGAGFNSSVF